MHVIVQESECLQQKRARVGWEGRRVQEEEEKEEKEKKEEGEGKEEEKEERAGLDYQA